MPGTTSAATRNSWPWQLEGTGGLVAAPEMIWLIPSGLTVTLGTSAKDCISSRGHLQAGAAVDVERLVADHWGQV